MLILLTAANRGASFSALVVAARTAGCNRASRSSISRSLRRLRAFGVVELHPAPSTVRRLRRPVRRHAKERHVGLRASRVVLTETGHVLLAHRSTVGPLAAKLLTD
jgi:hypothetical protein